MILTIKLYIHAKLNCLKYNYLYLSLNNLQKLIYHKIQPTNQQTNHLMWYWSLKNNNHFMYGS